MITVAGEALIDIVIGASGSVTALPGGAPFNVARTIARLGGDCQFLGKLSDDGFGEQLRSTLQEAGVRDRGRRRHAHPDPARDRQARRVRGCQVPVLPAGDVRGATDRRGCSPGGPRRVHRDRPRRPEPPDRAHRIDSDRANKPEAPGRHDPPRSQLPSGCRHRPRCLSRHDRRHPPAGRRSQGQHRRS